MPSNGEAWNAQSAARNILMTHNNRQARMQNRGVWKDHAAQVVTCLPDSIPDEESAAMRVDGYVVAFIGGIGCEDGQRINDSSVDQDGSIDVSRDFATHPTGGKRSCCLSGPISDFCVENAFLTEMAL
jgi:hypothetical protein